MIQLVPITVAHARTRPRTNAFRYELCYFAIPVSAWSRGRRNGFFSIDSPNLFSLWSTDYGDGRTPPGEWIRGILESQNLAEADGEIVLLTLPRLFGYAFNPISLWFCFDREHRLRAVLAEVNNTFGERHCYLCFHEGHEPIAADARLTVRKMFHVSPFMDVKGSYRFRFDFAPERIAVEIDLLDEVGVLLATSLRGRPQPLSAYALLKAAFAYPFQTLKVVALIHYQAAKLFLKGVRHFRKPEPPDAFVSR